MDCEELSAPAGGGARGSPETERARSALEKNLWSMWAQFGRTRGGALHEDREALWFETPIATPPYNMVLRFHGGGDPDAAIDRIRAHFRARGVPFLWLMHPSATPNDLVQRLRVRGIEEVEPITGMAADLRDLPAMAPLPAGVEIHDVTPEHDLAPFAALVAWRWRLGQEDMPHLHAIMDVIRIGAAGSPNRAWVVTRNGVPLAKAFTHDGAGAVGLYGMATKPEARGQGLARLVCIKALNDARARGHDLAILHATPMAVSLYRDLGFREAAPFSFYAQTPHSFYA